MLFEVIHREYVYLAFYLEVLLFQIVPYWIAGIVIGSGISVFGKSKIHHLVTSLHKKNLGIFGIVPACILGAISPLCMYGTIPIAASCADKGMREDWLAAFMMSSILLNPQLMAYSMALGKTVFVIRIVSCLAMGMLAGILVNFFCKKKKFFDFTGFGQTSNRDIDPNLFMRFVKNVGRNIKITGPYFIAGIVMAALFQRYVPQDAFAALFGNNRRFGVVLAASLGVPVYVCSGGTIPLLVEWLSSGMSIGAAAAFMITGPATKLTNLAALKMIFGMKKFLIYFLFTFFYAVAVGLLCNIIA